MPALRRSFTGRSPTGFASFVGLALLLLTLGACAAGDPRYSVDAPAGFWAGLWHGIISLIALILSLFTEVRFYETNNDGWWYDAGFLFGILCISGGGGGKVGHRRGRGRRREKERELEAKIEAKIEAKFREWADAEGDGEWETLAPKIAAKLQRELRKWVDEP